MTISLKEVQFTKASLAIKHCDSGIPTCSTLEFVTAHLLMMDNSACPFVGSDIMVEGIRTSVSAPRYASTHIPISFHKVHPPCMIRDGYQIDSLAGIFIREESTIFTFRKCTIRNRRYAAGHIYLFKEIAGTKRGVSNVRQLLRQVNFYQIVAICKHPILYTVHTHRQCVYIPAVRISSARRHPAFHRYPVFISDTPYSLERLPL